jgi:spore coat polysaccharide biosynthesis protein SpsF (cytidylyltransferase family)
MPRPRRCSAAGVSRGGSVAEGESLNFITLVQCRLASTRLPRKALKLIGDEPMILHVMRRASLILGKGKDSTILATTTNPEDDELATVVQNAGYDVFRGRDADVLRRFVDAALKFGADAVVRITGDCPLLDPAIGLAVVAAFQAGAFDYATNCTPIWPADGLDVEVISVDALQRAWAATDFSGGEYHREHVTTEMQHFSEQYPSIRIELRQMRGRKWSVDTAEDLDRVRAIVKRLTPGNFAMHHTIEVEDGLGQ